MLSALHRERARCEEIERLTGEQAALRRMGRLVACGAAPGTIFAAVAEEVGHVLPEADFTMVGRYETGGAVKVVGGWSRTGGHMLAGRRPELGGQNVSALVFEHNEPALVDHLDDDDDAVTAATPPIGVRSVAGAPISVEGRLRGVVIAASARDDGLPAGTEHRVAAFNELVATVIANAHAQAELAASRARIVAMADETRRRIERDLHDGAQQRLVSLALQLRAVQKTVPPELGRLRAELDGVAAGLAGTLDELREYAYFVASEALANAAKHAGASVVHVGAAAVGDIIRLVVRDDGGGGADPARGSGLVGLKDRVEAVGGTLSMRSRPGEGTTLLAEIPARPGQSSPDNQPGWPGVRPRRARCA